MTIRLGQQVKHIITGFEGIAISRTHFLQGCDRIEVSARVDKEGKLPDNVMFDEPELEVTGQGIFKEDEGENPIAKKTGGPHDYARTNSYSRRR